MIVISAQPNRLCFTGGAQNKTNYSVFNRIDDMQLLVFHPMMIRLFQKYMQYIKVIHPYLSIQLSKMNKKSISKEFENNSYLKYT